MADINTGLKGWWKWDGDALDSSGNGKDGTLVGSPTFAAAKIGQGLSLSGTGQYMTAPSVGVSGASPRSIGLWVKPNSVSVGTKTLYRSGVVTPNLAQLGIHCNVLSSGDIYLEHGNRDFYTATGMLSATALVHVLYVYTGATIQTAGAVVLYINGVSVSLTASGTATGALNTSDTDLNFGRDNLAAGRLLPGLLDEGRIYNRALSAPDAAALYAYRIPPAILAALADD